MMANGAEEAATDPFCVCFAMSQQPCKIVVSGQRLRTTAVFLGRLIYA
jgi:hypothetical protein